MSDSSERNGCLNGTYLALGALGLWLGWKLLVYLYDLLTDLSLSVFSRLDASYGRLGGAGGYALLGLGLGAAAGAIAAQQRFRLDKRILVGAVLGAVVLSGLALLGNPYSIAAQDEPMDYDLGRATPLNTTTLAKELSAQADAPAATLPDTTSQPAEGWLRVVVNNATLRASWVDSTTTPHAYLEQEDSVRVLRKAHQWVQVLHPKAASSGHVIGWIRLANLGPLPEPAAALAPEPTTQAFEKKSDMPLVITPITDSTATTAPDFPTGHRQYTGQVGPFHATFALDWQPNGELSGTCYYNQQPGTIYRLTGSLKASGELALLVFKRGQVAAKCVLQQQGNGYAGTMVNADGQQLAMTLE